MSSAQSETSSAHGNGKASVSCSGTGVSPSEPEGTPILRLAAIDIGTVTTRLIIADVSLGKVHELERYTVITHLGEGLAHTGRLNGGALCRVESAIASFRARIDAYLSPTAERPVLDTVALATSAARDAENGTDLIELLARYGFTLNVITGCREAELVFMGVASDFKDRNILVADVGGGSTELIFGHALSDEDEHFAASIEEVYSFDVGCRRLTDRFLQSELPTKDQIEVARIWARQELFPFFEHLEHQPECLVAVAGTATSIVAIEKGMDVYDSALVHKSEITQEVLHGIFTKLAALPLDSRMAIRGLEADRAGVILAGIIILEELLDLSGLASFVVSEADILYGMLIDAFKESTRSSKNG